MKILKENNQYYGEYIERAVNVAINKKSFNDINLINFNFSDEEIKEMNNDVLILCNFINGSESKYVGRETSNKSADLIVDGKEIELKYVKSGKGTYYNTTLDYVKTIGFKSYHDYLLEYGYITLLKEKFGDMVSLVNSSPVSIKNSSFIRHSMKKDYKEILPIEEEIRCKFCFDFYNYLIKNPEKKIQFINDMVSKNNSNKNIPDKLIVFNHSSKKIICFTKENIESLIDYDNLKPTKKGLVFGDIQIQFGWQNGNGLSNPTIRVFIK